MAVGVSPVFADVPNNAVTTKAYVEHVAGGKQPALNSSGDASLANSVVMYPATTGGEPGSKPIVTDLTANNVNTAGIPTVGAVNTVLADKQANIPAGTAGNVVTYTGIRGSVDAKAVYNPSSAYNATNSAALVQADHVNNAIQQGLNGHLACDETDKDGNQCWLYEIVTQAPNTVYTAHASN